MLLGSKRNTAAKGAGTGSKIEVGAERKRIESERERNGVRTGTGTERSGADQIQ